MLFLKKVKQGEAIVREGYGGTKIVFNEKIFVIPVLHRSLKVDLTKKDIKIRRLNQDALITKDHKHLNILATFRVRVNNTNEDVLKVINNIGAARTYDVDEVTSLFKVRFEESLKKIAYEFTEEDFMKRKSRFKIKVMNDIGRKHSGYNIEDLVIETK